MNSFNRFGNLGLFVLTLVASLTLVVPASAQYRATGDDGITASPRLRQQLDERKGALKAVQAAKACCPKCKTQIVARPVKDAQGSGARALTGNTTENVAKHLCPGCGVDWKVVGVGKEKTSVATHTCAGSAPAKPNCCSSTHVGHGN